MRVGGQTERELQFSSTFILFLTQVDHTNAIIAKETSLAERKRKRLDHFRDASQVRSVIVCWLILPPLKYTLKTLQLENFTLKSPGQPQCNACVCLRFCYVVGQRPRGSHFCGLENGGNN
jgi:hypothetical protein